MNSILIILGYGEPTWAKAKKILADNKALAHSLNSFDKDSITVS